MFENIGGKLKTLAILVFVSSILGGFGVVTIINASNPLSSFLIVAGSVLVGWLSSVGLYAFGQLVENSDRSVHLLANIEQTNRKILNAQEPSILTKK